jgi:hypothetical protein
MLTANIPAMNRTTASNVRTGPCFFTGPPPQTGFIEAHSKARGN